MQSLSNQLRRLELVGRTSDDAIHKVVHATAAAVAAAATANAAHPAHNTLTQAEGSGPAAVPPQPTAPAQHEHPSGAFPESSTVHDSSAAACTHGSLLWQAVASAQARGDAQYRQQGSISSSSGYGTTGPRRAPRSRRRDSLSAWEQACAGQRAVDGDARGAVKSIVGGPSKESRSGGVGPAAVHSGAGGLLDRMAAQAGRAAAAAASREAGCVADGAGGGGSGGEVGNVAGVRGQPEEAARYGKKQQHGGAQGQAQQPKYRKPW
eukprot:scaffold30706_cov17-Tisochrysis_lutea.AAC.2